MEFKTSLQRRHRNLWCFYRISTIFFVQNCDLFAKKYRQNTSIPKPK